MPSADGTLECDKTTMVVGTADASGQTGLGWTYSAEAGAMLVRTALAALRFDEPVSSDDVAGLGALGQNWSRMSPAGEYSRTLKRPNLHACVAAGVMTADSGRPGLGMELRAADAANFQVGC